MDQKLPPNFLGPFSIEPIIFLVFFLSSSLFPWIGLENAAEGSQGGSIWSIHCQKYTLTYVNTITNNLLWWSCMTSYATINILLEGGRVEVRGRRTTMVADDDGGRQQWHTWMGSGLQWGRTRAGSERRQRQRSGDDGCGGGGQRQQRQTMTVTDSNDMQDWAAAYEGDRQEWAGRDGRDTEWWWRLRRWKIAAVDDDSGGQQQRQQQTTTTATKDNDSSKRQQRWTMTACKIGRRTMGGKEESGGQATTTLEPAGQRAWKNKEIEFTQKDFFQQFGLSGWIFCSRRNTQWYLLDSSVLFLAYSLITTFICKSWS